MSEPMVEEPLAVVQARRDELAEARDLLEAAWGIIANAGWDGSAKTPGWQEAAIRWRERYFRG